MGAGSAALASPNLASADNVSLVEVLEQLRAEGIETLYTSRLVDEALSASPPPPTGSAEDRLRTLLSPHGLTVKPTSDGRWAVVAIRVATVSGCLVSDPGGQPIVGARLTLDGNPTRAPSDAAGCFRLLAVPAGRHTLEVSRPGYVARHVELDVEPGTARRVDLALRIDALTADTIQVSSAPEQPPLGTWRLNNQRLESARRSDPDLLAAVAEVPGSFADAGVAFSLRGRQAQRTTLVVDGVDVVEPFHFRDLGRLAGAVTPTAVAEVEVHRGRPPLVYGNRTGGVLEMVTASATARLTGRLTATQESEQAGLAGTLVQGRGRWMAAYRQGRPDLPREIGQLSSHPEYWDGLAKLSATLTPRQELSLQAFWADDDFSFLRLGDRPQSLVTGQASRHIGARYLLSLGSRHLIEALVTDVEVERPRSVYEDDPELLVPIGTAGPYQIDDSRITKRRVRRIEGHFTPEQRLTVHWGVESSRERTVYDYLGYSQTLRDPNRTARFTRSLNDQRLGLFAQGTWRPRANLTLEAGLRWDDNELDASDALAPRVAFSWRRGVAVWQGSWARAIAVPFTHALALADGELTLPGSETTDYLSLGYRRPVPRGHVVVEVYDQKIDDPNPRWVNLFRPISRVPEFEIDRFRLTPEASRMSGVEVRLTLAGTGWRAGATYLLSRSEDAFDEGWFPRREDQRHGWSSWFAVDLPAGFRGDLRWVGSTGAPTTPFDVARRAQEGFGAALGEYHSARLPADHQLDLRLSRPWRWRGLTLNAEAGIDNLYDRRRVRGFDLEALNRETPDTLPPELGLGRRFRWGLEVSW